VHQPLPPQYPGLYQQPFVELQPLSVELYCQQSLPQSTSQVGFEFVIHEQLIPVKFLLMQVD
jgi:hypothetical protein